MDPIVADWISLALRWAHVMVGIMWIGTSFHFIWLDASLRREQGMGEGLAGASWMVHGGGFYRATKFLVAPPEMPADLHWFKYEAYFTWITGFLLLAVIYYLGANDLLIDPRVMELTPLKAIGISLGGLAAGWIIYDLLCRSPIGERTGLLAFLVFLLACAASYGFTQVFSGRAAFVHIGAFLGTIMTANVFLIIIPNQKKVVAALIAGQTPDPALGKRAKQRSLHNNYLTLPVVLMMISNHYPMMFEHERSWLIVVGILLFSGLVRLYANMKNAGASGSPVTAILFYAAMVGVGAIGYASYRPDADLEAVGPVTFADVQAIMAHRCQACHSATPSDTAYKVPPKGVAFDTADQIQRMAPQIERVVVLTKAMPLANKTGMLPEERLMIAKWLSDFEDGRGMMAQTFKQAPSSLDRAAFVALHGRVYEHSPWIAEAVWDAGLTPACDTVEGLHHALAAVVDAAPRARQLALLGAHPDLAGRLAVRGELTAESTSEQASAGLDKCTPAEFQRFTELNDAYRRKFPFPFIMAVKGKSRGEILEAFERRIRHDEASEFRTALSEVHKIALIRLRGL